MNYLDPILGLGMSQDLNYENAGLNLLHYLVLKLMIGMPITVQDNMTFFHKMAYARVKDGLYLRSKNHQNRTVSHDEITGMIGTSHILRTFHAKSIIDYLTNHYGNYPATGENKFYNPANYYAWGTLTNKWWAPVFAPIYIINLIISTNKPKQDTSSKLIYLDELYLMKSKSMLSGYLWIYFCRKMENMYGSHWIKALYDIYYINEPMDHPLRELSHRVQQ